MQTGRTIAGRYVLRQMLGAGGMGEVWAGYNAATERPVAVKVLYPGVTQSALARTRFMREARASARINNPNVIDVYDAGEAEDGTLYLAMELLDGMPLASALRAYPAMLLRDFLVIVADACRGLGAAHAVGIVHRDIKPENIFLHREKGAPFAHGKVLDFGISKFTSSVDAAATTAGTMLGSPRFMSPEQVRGLEEIDHRADLWAMGVLLFRGLAGRWPHEGESLTGLAIQIGTRPPVDIDAVAPGAPPILRNLVKACLSPIEQRFASAADLAERLEAIAVDPSITGVRVSPMLSDPTSGISGDAIRVRVPGSPWFAQSGAHPLLGSGAHPVQLVGVQTPPGGLTPVGGVTPAGGMPGVMTPPGGVAMQSGSYGSGVYGSGPHASGQYGQPIAGGETTGIAAVAQGRPPVSSSRTGVVVGTIVGVAVFGGLAAVGAIRLAASRDDATAPIVAPAPATAEPTAAAEPDDEPAAAEPDDEPTAQPTAAVEPTASPTADTSPTATASTATARGDRPPPIGRPKQPPPPPKGKGVVGEDLGSGL
jgi:serine/threonine-protein kinase